MSVVKVIEIISEGKTIEAALQAAVTEAAKTLHNIKQVNVENISGIVEEGTKITKFRVDTKISFVVDDKSR